MSIYREHPKAAAIRCNWDTERSDLLIVLDILAAVLMPRAAARSTDFVPLWIIAPFISFVMSSLVWIFMRSAPFPSRILAHTRQRVKPWCCLHFLKIF